MGDKVRADLRVARAERFVERAMTKLAYAAKVNEDGSTTWEVDPLSEKELIVLVSGLAAARAIQQAANNNQPEGEAT